MLGRLGASGADGLGARRRTPLLRRTWTGDAVVESGPSSSPVSEDGPASGVVSGPPKSLWRAQGRRARRVQSGLARALRERRLGRNTRSRRLRRCEGQGMPYWAAGAASSCASARAPPALAARTRCAAPPPPPPTRVMAQLWKIRRRLRRRRRRSRSLSGGLLRTGASRLPPKKNPGKHGAGRLWWGANRCCPHHPLSPTCRACCGVPRRRSRPGRLG